MPDPSPLNFVLKYPHQCTREVSRRGEIQPCDNAAYMVCRDPEDGHLYPVCRFHGQGEDTLTLAELLIQAVRL